MFKNLQEKFIFIGVGILALILAFLIAKLWVLVPLAIGVIIGTLYYANSRLEGGLPSPISIFKEQVLKKWQEKLKPFFKEDEDKSGK
jgi:membrane protein implicated in regulation of membrane protease activity